MGKSTTMRMIMGLDRPDAGQVRIDGKMYGDLRWPLRDVGALLEAKAFHPGRTARAHLAALAASNAISRRRVEQVLDITGLEKAADRRAGKFSLGMSQRLGLAAALLGDPGVLLRSLAAQGRTVLVSSHLISEMAMTADALIVIGRGRLLAQTTVTQLSARSGYGFRTVAAMEWRKLRTVRSTWYILAAFIASMIVVAVLALRHESYAQLSAADRASFDPVHDSFIGLVLGQLLLGSLGVLAITAEFSSGMIRATFAAVPRRPLVLTAKAAVLGAVTLAAGEISAFTAFAAGQAVLKAPAPHAALGQPGVLRAVLMAGAYPALIALIGLGAGAVIRHTAGALCAIVGVLFVLPLLFVSPSLQNAAPEPP